MGYHIINRRKFLEIFGYSCCSLIISSCATVPITERRQLTLLPESYINRQGVLLYENVKKKTKLSDDKSTLLQIKQIGNKIENAVSWYFNEVGNLDQTSLVIKAPSGFFSLAFTIIRITLSEAISL